MASPSIIIFSILLSVIYLFSLINFKLSLCDSNTRLSIICWNIIFIVIIINFFILGFQKKDIVTIQSVEEITTTEEPDRVEICKKKKTNGATIFFTTIGIILFLVLCFYGVKRLNLC